MILRGGHGIRQLGYRLRQALRARQGPIQSTHVHTMNNDTNPIDHFIALMLVMIEGICWIINELAGHHKDAPRVRSRISDATINDTIDSQLKDHVMSLTVKQLRKVTGKTNSRLRKADLIALALG